MLIVKLCYLETDIPPGRFAWIHWILTYIECKSVRDGFTVFLSTFSTIWYELQVGDWLLTDQPVEANIWLLGSGEGIKRVLAEANLGKEVTVSLLRRSETNVVTRALLEQGVPIQVKGRGRGGAAHVLD